MKVDMALRYGAIAVLTLIMVTQFMNCGTYSADTNLSLSSTAVACTNASCITPTADNLSVKVNLGGGSEYSVYDGYADWNFGGDCNEGGFPYNIIKWQLYLDGSVVRYSDETGMVAGNPSANVNSICTNGRFMLYINLNAIPADPTNRSGLNSPLGRRQYDLYIQIFGQDTPGGVLIPGTQSGGRVHVSLLPI